MSWIYIEQVLYNIVVIEDYIVNIKDKYKRLII